MFKLNPHARAALGLSILLLLSACGGSGSNGIESEQPLLDATVQEGFAGVPITERPSESEFVPNLGQNLNPVNSAASQDATSNNEFIVTQWLDMQNCLQVSAVEPLVTVVEGRLTPLTTNDDVVRHIDGVIQASSNVTDIGATIQVRAADFDGSLGAPGFYLRSIMGRYLWLSNGFAERDYPHECATGS